MEHFSNDFSKRILDTFGETTETNDDGHKILS
jgi:hypothetical protein